MSLNLSWFTPHGHSVIKYDVLSTECWVAAPNALSFSPLESNNREVLLIGTSTITCRLRVAGHHVSIDGTQSALQHTPSTCTTRTPAHRLLTMTGVVQVVAASRQRQLLLLPFVAATAATTATAADGLTPDDSSQGWSTCEPKLLEMCGQARRASVGDCFMCC